MFSFLYFIFFFLCLVSLLEGSLSGVEALRHVRLDLQAKKKVIPPPPGLDVHVFSGYIKMHEY
jgi:hypothetical protein